ncbi:type II toxin-antitoxin system RelE/ParE family toxin [Shinella sp. PSBB067]|jgi:plasmid stabilization system protein ParE|uniref:type II toxin-antitoxin system RelE/ParE family toxin n=1 Tax=Shinella sp. PSBB067 TaxID=2715959 RepID=UPI00193C2343|nr:type II toxin-antitoxin system RelE/ParE family toxin [Shinella sp. PSBB067]QRI64523.1 type II toxin-antitoxin system RelE/ParE family toxin [Shinella sp. PSBB067]
MPKSWRLTRQAEASLVEIARWTLETFGPRQATAYEEDLIARCEEIAARVAMSQDCRRIIDTELPEDLRFARCGQHFVIFVEDAQQVIIIDFLHARSDLPRRLEAITKSKPDRDH